LFTEDIGQKPTDNYEQVPNAATNDQFSHSLGRKQPFDFADLEPYERPL